MKSVLLGFLITLSFITGTHAREIITIEPTRPAKCKTKKDDYKMLNQIFSAYKTETADQLIVLEIETRVIRCEDGKATPYSLNNPKIDLYKEGVNFPWTKVGAIYSVESIITSLAKITISFDKKKLFAKKSHREFSYAFYPFSGSVQASDLHFDWVIYLDYVEQNGQSSTTVRLAH